MKKKIRFYKALLREVIETLCTICLYLEKSSRYGYGNSEGRHMRSHFTILKGFSDDLRDADRKTHNYLYGFKADEFLFDEGASLYKKPQAKKEEK